MAASVDAAASEQIATEYLARLKKKLPAGPFAPLFRRDTPKINRQVVSELLQNPEVGPQELILIARKIQGWRSEN